MLFLNGQPFFPRRMDKAGENSTGGGSSGEGGQGQGSEGSGAPNSAEGGQSGKDGDTEDLPADQSKWTPEQTNSYIQKLRKENQSSRARFKVAEAKTTQLEERFSKFEKGLKNLTGGGEDDSETPEQRIEQLEQRESDREEQQAINDMNQAVLQTAYALKVPNEALDYFKFLIQQEAEQMNDEDAISDESLAEMAQKAIKHAGGSEGGTTSADGQGGKKTPAPEGKGSGVTVAQFAKMTVAERSALYQRNQDEYSRLMQECKDQKLLFN